MEFKKIIFDEKYFFILIFIFSFIVRTIFFVSVFYPNKNYWTADSAPYHNVAVQLANFNGYSNNDDSPSFFRLPGYSTFLAVFYKIFNFKLFKTFLVQIFLASLIPILIFFLSLSLFPGYFLLARVVSAYSAIHMGFIIYSGLLMSETMFCFLFFIFLILLFLKKYLSAGVFLGLSSLVRPVGQYVIFIALFLIILEKICFTQRFKKISILLFSWFLVILGWLLRNYLLTGMVFFHTLPGKHFLYHSAAYIVMQKDNLSYVQAKQNLINQIDGKKLDEVDFCFKAEKLALSYIKNNPFIFIKHSFGNIIKTIFSPFSSEFSYMQKNKISESKIKSIFFPKINGKLKYFLYIELFFMFFIYLGFIGFIYRSCFDNNLFLILFKILPFVGLFVFLTLASGFARLRLPIEPLVFIPSFYFWLKRLKIK